jgi:cell division transport system permease protein
MSRAPHTRARHPVRPRWRQRLATWWRHHRLENKRALRELTTQPVASLMTILVLGVALSMPAGLKVLLNNAEQLAGGMEQSSKLSLYLNKDISETRVHRLINDLRQRADLKAVRGISPDEGLAEFEQRAGLGDTLQYLDDNPLPWVIEVLPGPIYQDPDKAEQLLDELQKLPDVEVAQLDLQWVKRLHAILAVARQSVMAIGLLFALAVVLVIGNTIRLAIQNHKTEIEVIKLVGGTNGFIRRPFLYTGLWFGVAGGITAWLLVGLTITFLGPSVSRLAEAYNSRFALEGLTPSDSIWLLATGAILGWVGAWLSVSRHIRDIEPS